MGGWGILNVHCDPVGSPLILFVRLNQESMESNLTHHRPHERVLTGRVYLCSLLLTKDLRIWNTWFSKIPQKKQRRAEEAAQGSKERFEETGAQDSEQEHSVRNVSDSSASSSILNRKAEASLEFIDHEYDVTKVQLEKIEVSLTNIKERLLKLESTID